MHTGTQNPLLSLRLERSGVPIYVQIREHVLAAVSKGELRPGNQMPTMRQVAVALRVDLNTVRRAYEELERLGVVELRPGRGSFVASASASSPAPPINATLTLAKSTLAAAARMGVDPKALAERLLELADLREEDL